MLIEIKNPIEFKELEIYLLKEGYIKETLHWSEVDKNIVSKFKTPFIDYETDLVKYIGRNNSNILLLNREGTIVYAKYITYPDLVIRIKNFNDHKDKINFRATHEQLIELIHETIINGKTPCPISLVENIRDDHEYIRLTINNFNPELKNVIHSWLQHLANRKLAYGPYPLSFFIP